jgi:hypothetical protein
VILTISVKKLSEACLMTTSRPSKTRGKANCRQKLEITKSAAAQETAKTVHDRNAPSSAALWCLFQANPCDEWEVRPRRAQNPTARLSRPLNLRARRATAASPALTSSSSTELHLLLFIICNWSRKTILIFSALRTSINGNNIGIE